MEEVRGTARASVAVRPAECACPLDHRAHPQTAVYAKGELTFCTHLIDQLRPMWAGTLAGQPHLGFEYTGRSAVGAAIRLWVPARFRPDWSIGLPARCGPTRTPTLPNPPGPTAASTGSNIPIHQRTSPTRGRTAADQKSAANPRGRIDGPVLRAGRAGRSTETVLTSRASGAMVTQLKGIPAERQS